EDGMLRVERIQLESRSFKFDYITTLRSGTRSTTASSTAAGNTGIAGAGITGTAGGATGLAGGSTFGATGGGGGSTASVTGSETDHQCIGDGGECQCPVEPHDRDFE